MKRINFFLFQELKVNFKIWTVVLVILFILLRLYMLQVPHLEKTKWKEIDYIQISKNYTKEGIHFWEPTISWPAEGPRVTAMEFPLVPYLASGLYQVFGFNAFTVRILTLISFILLSVYLYKTVVLLTRDRGLAMLSLLLSLILPLNNIFGILLLSEPAIVALVMITIYHMLKWKQTDHNRYFTYSFLFFALSLLLKPTAMYVALPMLYIYYLKTGNLKPRYYLRFVYAFFLAIIPASLWYAYAYHLTQVSIDVFGVFGGHNKFQTFAMLSNPDWWSTMFERFYKLFGGVHMFTLFWIGFIGGVFDKSYRLFYVFFISNLIFLFVMAEGNLDAPYRQFAFIASGSFFMGVGCITLASVLKGMYDSLTKGIRFLPFFNLRLLFGGICLILLANFAYDFIDKTPSKTYVAHQVSYEIAQDLRSLSTEQTKIVTAGNYTVHKGGNDLSPVLYYYSGLQGWSLERKDWSLEKIKELKSKGADLFVGMNTFTYEADEFIDRVADHYPVICQTERYVICDLSQKEGVSEGF